MNTTTTEDSTPSTGVIDASVAPAIAALHDRSTPLLATLARCYEAGVRSICWEFSGSGDSGQLDGTTTLGTDGQHFDIGDELDRELGDAFYSLVEKHVTCDWYNNDGGGGTIEIDLTTMEMKVKSYYNVMESCDHDNTALNLATGEPVEIEDEEGD